MTNIHTKVAQMLGDFLGLLKFDIATFWATFGNIRLLFIPTSSNTNVDTFKAV